MPQQSRSKIKIMLPVFFDYNYVVHYEAFSPGQTVNIEYYLSFMCVLAITIRLKRSKLGANLWVSSPCYTKLVMCDFFGKNLTYFVPLPPYWPDLALWNFCPFRKFIRLGRRFATIEEGLLGYTGKRLFRLF